MAGKGVLESEMGILGPRSTNEVNFHRRGSCSDGTFI